MARGLIFVVVLAALLSPLLATTNAVAQGRTVRLTVAEMFKLADLASARGDVATAAGVYAALEQNPDADIRAEARFRHAKQLVWQKRNREAAVLLRRIVDEKPDASVVRLELARLLQVLGDTDAALRELRAAQALGLPPVVARMIDRYSEALRGARPMGASLEVAIAPDSNINHSTRSDTLGTVLGDFEIDDDSKARSGIGLSIRGQAYRRLRMGGGDHSWLVRMGVRGDLYGKSRFNDIAADLVAGPEFQLGRSRANLELGATQRWFGQKPFLRSARIAATWNQPLGRRTQVRLNGSASIVDNHLNDLQDGTVYSGQVAIERTVTATTGLGFTIGVDRQSLRDAGYSTAGWRAGLVGWKDVGRMTLSAGADLGRSNADERLALFPDNRSDRYSRFTLAATFRQFTFQGFAPVARFKIERNRSTIEFYDYKRTRSEFAIVRAF